MELSLAQIEQHLKAGRHLQCEAAAHNGVYQFTNCTYTIQYWRDEPNDKEWYILVCRVRDGQLWQAEYASMKELLEGQPFRLEAFRLEGKVRHG